MAIFNNSRPPLASCWKWTFQRIFSHTYLHYYFTGLFTSKHSKSNTGVKQFKTNSKKTVEKVFQKESIQCIDFHLCQILVSQMIPRVILQELQFPTIPVSADNNDFMMVVAVQELHSITSWKHEQKTWKLVAIWSLLQEVMPTLTQASCAMEKPYLWLVFLIMCMSHSKQRWMMHIWL